MTIRPISHKPLLLAGLLFCAALLGPSCRKHAPDSETAAPAASRNPVVPNGTAADPSSAGAPQVAAWVNYRPIYQHEVDRVARDRALDSDAARQLLVEAEAVAQEALVNPHLFKPTATNDRFLVAREYLEAFFNDEVLCNRITDQDLKMFYQTTYDPKWLGNVYRGEVVELRCCPSGTTDCSDEQVRTCMAQAESILPFLEGIGQKWQLGTAPDPAAFKQIHQNLVYTDFGFIIYPNLPLEQHRSITLFEPESLARITALPPETVSDPFLSGLGVHLVRIRDVRTEKNLDDPEVRRMARESVCRSLVESTRKDFVARLVSAAVKTPPPR